ncbi:hypothetical protein SAMN05880582_107195 [Rhizobium sp. RU20A]|uniref:hypothetical protein n=1 Tax=Rhizobium sp. RU20A TaxID=1907412 RepID=UPI000956983F|nr:hypothetical protein [Rhizobium sp. RU20A]SIR19358.1 hypothetical protein SAMN05880582_107195 [Rhizobium sp. RU20A]
MRSSRPPHPARCKLVSILRLRMSEMDLTGAELRTLSGYTPGPAMMQLLRGDAPLHPRHVPRLAECLEIEPGQLMLLAAASAMNPEDAAHFEALTPTEEELRLLQAHRRARERADDAGSQSGALPAPLAPWNLMAWSAKQMAHWIRALFGMPTTEGGLLPPVVSSVNLHLRLLIRLALDDREFEPSLRDDVREETIELLKAVVAGTSLLPIEMVADLAPLLRMPRTDLLVLAIEQFHGRAGSEVVAKILAETPK